MILASPGMAVMASIGLAVYHLRRATAILDEHADTRCVGEAALAARYWQRLLREVDGPNLCILVDDDEGEGLEAAVDALEAAAECLDDALADMDGDDGAEEWENLLDALLACKSWATMTSLYLKRD